MKIDEIKVKFFRATDFNDARAITDVALELRKEFPIVARAADSLRDTPVIKREKKLFMMGSTVTEGRMYVSVGRLIGAMKTLSESPNLGARMRTCDHHAMAIKSRVVNTCQEEFETIAQALMVHYSDAR